MRKLVAVFCMASLSIMLLGGAFGADENKGASNAQRPAERMRPPQGAMLMDNSIAFISGSISKVDTTAPESVKVEMINDADGKSHVIEIGVGTNILKGIEAGELKAGDKARIVARRAGDKEIALNIVTGKLTKMPRPSAPIVPAPIVKKDKTKN